MKQGARYFIVLLVICGVAASLLAAVYVVTKEPIAASRKAKTMNAVQTVLPAADRLVVEPEDLRKLLGSTSDEALPEIYPAFQGDRLVGVAIKVTDPNGYAGNIDLMVGVTADGKVHAINVLQHKETPGLGSKMVEPAFAGQFKDLTVPDNGVKVKKDGGLIEAITGATISSRAVTRAVNEAVKKFREIKPRLAPAPAPAAGGNHG